MTLVLTAVSGDYAIQVSDRRLTQAGELVEDEANKAVLFCNRFTFAFTGLGEINGVRTDEWLTNVLVNARTENLRVAIDFIAQEATKAFRNIPYTNSQKRHTFIGVGWTRLPSEPFISPIMCSISNEHSSSNVWLDEASDTFTAFHRIGPREPVFEVRANGRHLRERELSKLSRKIRRCFEKKTRPEPVVHYLAEQIHKVASRNKLVGKNLMVVCLPKASVSSNSPYLLTDASPLAKKTMSEVNSFYYIGANKTKLVFGPNTACGGQGFRDFKIEKLNESGSNAFIQATIVLPTNDSP